MPKKLTIEDAKARPVEELLQEVHDTQETVRVALAEGHEIDINPAPKLKLLITFAGYVPDGWKDAIYEPKR